MNKRFIVFNQAPVVVESKKDRSRGEKKKKSGPSPWRSSDPVPKDTWRYNYLNNDEAAQQVTKK